MPGKDAPHHATSAQSPGPPPRQRGREPLWRDVLGEHLRSLRRDRGETLAETAGRAGVSPQYLSEVERGIKEPSSEMIAAVAGALGTSLVDLTTGVVERLRSSAMTAMLGARPARRSHRAYRPYAAGLCRSSITSSMSPYSLAASAVKTRSWSVSARSRSMSWLVCRDSIRSMSARTRTTSSA